ncbi:hypothetical protein Tco_0035167, partial [Tanacetum coccineum]
QNRRDLPRDIPLDSVVVLRYEKRIENKGKMLTEMKLVPEQIQQGTSYEVSVSAEGVEELKRKVKIKEHQSDTKVFTMTMEILLETTSNKLMVDKTVSLARKFFTLLPDHTQYLGFPVVAVSSP